jgi:hypothetical protein
MRKQPMVLREIYVVDVSRIEVYLRVLRKTSVVPV